jgi:hypothetical protein
MGVLVLAMGASGFFKAIDGSGELAASGFAIGQGVPLSSLARAALALAQVDSAATTHDGGSVPSA